MYDDKEKRIRLKEYLILFLYILLFVDEKNSK